MNRTRTRLSRRFSLILAVVLTLAVVAPAVTRAASGLTIGGPAVIAGANGDHVRLRDGPSVNAAIVASLSEGTTVTVVDGPVASPDDGSLWYRVSVDGATGYMAGVFLASPAGAVAGGGTGGSATGTGTAVIVNTNGDGIRCRAAPSTDAAVITKFYEGAAVDLMGEAAGGWQPVRCVGRTGYVHSEFLATGTTGSGSAGGGTPTGSATVTGTNGDGARCRTGSSFDAAVITVLAEGTVVSLRGAATDGWQPVVCAGQSGFVHAEFVGAPAGDGGSGGTAGGPGTPAPHADLAAGDRATVTGTNGDGVRLRAAASFEAAVITVVREGTVVDVVAGSTGDWVAVSAKGNTGFIHWEFLVRATVGGDSGGGATGGTGHGTLTAGDHAMATDNLRLRSGASSDAVVEAVAATGTVVAVTGPRRDGFYPVDWDGLTGYMHGDYLTWTDAPVTPRGTGGGGDAGSGTGSAQGQAMADYAMQYLGYPYVWATHGPDSFDCSGFTYWVALHVLGKNIGTGTFTQIDQGTPVSYGDLQPGDLVFFQNTYAWGLSHVGIYIGGNTFIHAENEQTGVKISSLTSPYYASRWYGAVRLTS